MNVEGIGSKFNREDYLQARLNTKKAVKKAASLIKAGLSEEEAIALLVGELKILGVEKYWHPIKLRMNINTVNNFKDPSMPTILSDNDIYFIDIGPVFFNHEGDYGETMVMGNDPALLNLQRATTEVFKATAQAWREKKLSGIELYQFATDEAKKFGLILNSNMYGHRLGDFPHALHFKGDLGEVETLPSSDLWVLEIHLLDEKISRGAFFEDILFLDEREYLES